MRNKRETDISQYKDIQPEINPAVRKVNPIKRFFKALGKFIFTIFSVCVVAGLIAAISLGIYIASLASEPPNPGGGSSTDSGTDEKNRLTRQVLLWYKIQTASLNSIKLFTAQKTEFGLTTKRFRRL